MEIAITIVAINWLGCLAFSWLYCGVLVLTGDIRLEGWVWWRHLFPVARFRLVSRKSWFARAWARWYGHALLGCLIHRDEKGDFDDAYIEEVIVHELRHCVQQLVFGLTFYLLYGLHFVLLSARRKNGYRDNWFERDARAAAFRWVEQGRQYIFDFGERR